jgi:hypothetical protein
VLGHLLFSCIVCYESGLASVIDETRDTDGAPRSQFPGEQTDGKASINRNLKAAIQQFRQILEVSNIEFFSQ